MHFRCCDPFLGFVILESLQNKITPGCEYLLPGRSWISTGRPNLIMRSNKQPSPKVRDHRSTKYLQPRRQFPPFLQHSPGLRRLTSRLDSHKTPAESRLRGLCVLHGHHSEKRRQFFRGLLFIQRRCHSTTAYAMHHQRALQWWNLTVGRMSQK